MKKFEYKKSNLHGGGLFATRDIKENEIICFYYGKMVRVKKRRFHTYGLAYDDNYAIIGETDIKKLPPGGYGQFLNDGGFFKTQDDIFINGINSLLGNSKIGESVYATNKNRENIINILEFYLLYILESINKDNVRFVKDLKQKKIFIQSTRDIKKGEELLIYYGINYWISYYTKKYKNKIKFNGKILHFDKLLMLNLGTLYTNIRNKWALDQEKLNRFDTLFDKYITSAFTFKMCKI